jgi:hypothetical protein
MRHAVRLLDDRCSASRGSIALIDAGSVETVRGLMAERSGSSKLSVAPL